MKPQPIGHWAPWQKASWLFLAAVFLTPPAPAFADATAYARVRRDGTVDLANSKGVLEVNKVFTGTYCFNLSAPARVGVASANALENRPINATVFVPGDGAMRLSACPRGFPYAVITILPNGAKSDSSFYVIFF